MKSLTKYLLLIIGIFFISPHGGWTQTFSFHFETKWSDKGDKCTPCQYNVGTQEVSSTITKKIKLRGNYDFTYELNGISYEEIEFPSYYSKDVLPTSTEIEVSFGTSRDENFITIIYDPLINDNGVIRMVKDINVSVTGVANPVSYDRAVEFASVSVLASGDWYKIGVLEDGIQKIDYNMLSDLGIAVESINPSHINIYGNHIPELPFENWIERPDDLEKNNIHIAGEGDGSFDAGDYILFYAKGPDNPWLESGKFKPRKNKIDSMAYYFIHVDPSDSPKRIGTALVTDDPVTHTVNAFDDYALHEINETNLLKSGDGWFGDHFEGNNLMHSINFDLENRQTSEPIGMALQYVVASKSGTSGLKVNANGTEIADIIATNLNPLDIYTVAKTERKDTTINTAIEDLNLNLTFHRTLPSAEAWLDYVQLNFKRKLQMGSSQLLFRHFESVGEDNTAAYTISNVPADLLVWEITDPYNVNRVNGTLTGSNYLFNMATDSLRTYAAFRPSQAKRPIISGNKLGKIKNQNLHGLSQADYVIITHEKVRVQAERLANLHRDNGLTVHVIDIYDVYNEFSGGASDPVAVRWFAKMFYDRVGTDPDNTLKYLCLFGDGTYDPLNRIPNNNYLLPTFASPETGPVDYTPSYTSDDFFGLLDDGEAMKATDMLDIGVGRIPVTTEEVAEQVVNKIEHYMRFGSTLFSNTTGIQCDANGYASTFGDWRNRVVLMSDDIDKEYDKQFVLDGEIVDNILKVNNPEVNVVKIYLDAYKQVVTSGGQRYPDVEEAINQNMNKGALVFNYIGHGGETGLSLERVVSIPMIESWNNINNMPIFISATCEFSRFDDPGRISAGETTLTTPYGGAVGLLTTTRLVSIIINSILVENLYSVMFLEENGAPLALGEIIRRTKNLTLLTNNTRNFALLGDPALTLGRANPRIVTDSINGVSIDMVTDTLKALSRITVTGHVESDAGTLLSDYSGVVYPTVYDKRKGQQTLGQNIYNIVLPFDVQNNIIYKGKSTVKNGKFSFTFVVPKDINYAIGKGKISYYSNDDNSHNYGADTTVIVGGVDPNGIVDDIGPEIELFMNDESFVNGGITDEKPLFLANVRDENGINTTGNGIGHNITLIIDGNTANPVVLNNFYEADLDTYQSGKVSYRLSDLEEGAHQITFKVWDVNNNSSEATLDFIVMGDEEVGISHLLNYPNPFTTNTDFFFEHNQVCNSMTVKIEIFTVSGKLVKTILETVHTAGFRSEGINWNGRDDFGDKLGRGVYVYRLSIETEEGKKAEKIEKLVIL